MAEFQEVMKQWRRMCKMLLCDGCQLDGFCASYPKEYTDVEIAMIEDKVMNWAKSHPEPVYPTWLEWLECNDIFHRPEVYPHVYATTVGKKAFDPIPADIAQKLGLEPKEE